MGLVWDSASIDCVRLWNTADLWDPESNMKKTKSGVPFRIVAGHHGGTVSKIRKLYPVVLLYVALSRALTRRRHVGQISTRPESS